MPQPKQPNWWNKNDEQSFQQWYGDHSKSLGLNPNPDDPKQFYDYRSAYRAGANPKTPVDDIPIREPYPSELDYFNQNPAVAGMAANDNAVILNPFGELTEEQKNAVIRNEKARVYMRIENLKPDFDVTDEQQRQFMNYGNKQDIAATIAARIFSKDPSAGKITKQQREWVNNNLEPHWPSQFKLEGHPRMIVNGVNTKTGGAVRKK